MSKYGVFSGPKSNIFYQIICILVSCLSSVTPPRLSRLGKRSNISQSVFRSLFYASYKTERAFCSAICTCHDLRKRKRNYKAFFQREVKSDEKN